MINSRLNRRKVGIYSVLKFFSFFFLIFLAIFVSYKFYKSNILISNLNNNVEKFSQKYGFFLKEVKINNLKNISFSEVNQHFEVYKNKSIFLIPIKKISTKLEQNKWIQTVSIKSDYKNTITLIIDETNPIGIYFNEDNYFFFDNNGKIIDFVNSKNLDLVIFNGINSLSNANLFLKSVPILFKDQIKEATFVKNRRWDVNLKNGIKLKLGENSILKSFENYNKIYKSISNQELEEIELIDLRMPKKAIIKFEDL